jgi:ferredoxin-NADP reductase
VAVIIDPYTWRHLPIQHISRLTADTISVRLPRPDGYSFRAGQYAVVRVVVDGMPLLRQYSFASAPGNDFIELLVQRETDGEVSGWFHDKAKVNDHLEISQPFGSFTWEGEPESLLLIAGRVGIAPLLSIVREHELKAAENPVSVLYSVREADQILHRDLLENITSFFVTSDGQRITADILKECVRSSTTAYVCGSKRFVDGVTSELRTLGVSEAHIKRELFTLQ